MELTGAKVNLKDIREVKIQNNELKYLSVIMFIYEIIPIDTY